MSRTYTATGINLKSMPLGENDRLLTILTREFGLIRAVAPGARKHKSQFGGRSGLFVVNQLLIAKGRSLDKITSAETLQSFPGLAKELSKLASSQYMAEMVLCQALSEQPQEQLYDVLNEHLRRLEQLPSKSSEAVLSHLCHGVFHLLALAGIAPQVHFCCLTQRPLQPNFTNPNWRVGFSVDAGGAVTLAANASSEPTASVETPPRINAKLNAVELALLQQLASSKLTQLEAQCSADKAWVSVERILRQYTQHHLGRSIRSAALMEACYSW